MIKKGTFYGEFFRKNKMLGAISPSSSALSKKLIRPIDFSKAKTIVELGPGNGCITKHIIKKMQPDTQLLLFELNESFVEHYLQFDNPNIHVISDSAEKIRDYLNDLGIDKVDAIVSALPFSNMPFNVRVRILKACADVLADDGIFMQYQYMITIKKVLNRYFKNIKVGYMPWNVPPAFVYTCKK